MKGKTKERLMTVDGRGVKGTLSEAILVVVSKIIRSPRSRSAANFLCKETSWQPDYFAHPKY